MKRSIAILLLSITAYGQQNAIAPQKLAPQGPPGTVTLTLAEFNRLVEIAARKPFNTSRYVVTPINSYSRDSQTSSASPPSIVRLIRVVDKLCRRSNSTRRGSSFDS